MSEVTFYEYDLETIKEGFNKWLDKWKESVIDEEFNDPHERGTVQKIEDDNSLKFKFITEFNFSITKMSEDEILKTMNYSKLIIKKYISKNYA